MNIIVSPLSDTPIYEQIRLQIKELVLSGAVRGGAQLPSIRLMARDLQVGIITVKRAYEELEKEGILSNLQGRGCFVNELNTEKIKNLHLEMLQERLDEIRDFADAAGITKDEFLMAVDKVYGGCDNDQSRT